MKKLFLFLLLVLAFISVTTADASHFNLHNKSMLEFTLSARDYSDNLYGYDYRHRNSFEDAKFSIGVNHWTTNFTAMTFSISALDVTDHAYYESYGIYGTKSTIVPMYFGTRFYMTNMNGVMPINPYISIAGGPVLGINNYKDYGDELFFDEDVYLTFGGYAGGGIDMKFGKRTTIGIKAGYNFIADFSEYIGERKDFSGAEIGLSLGILFGGDDSKQTNKKHKHGKRVRKF